MKSHNSKDLLCHALNVPYDPISFLIWVVGLQVPPRPGWSIGATNPVQPQMDTLLHCRIFRATHFLGPSHLGHYIVDKIHRNEMALITDCDKTYFQVSQVFSIWCRNVPAIIATIPSNITSISLKPFSFCFQGKVKSRSRPAFPILKVVIFSPIHSHLGHVCTTRSREVGR